MKTYKQFINESINQLKYYIFDWDDNILFLDTPIHFEHFVDGEWKEEIISAKKLVDIKAEYPQYWDNEEWRCDFEVAFIEFRDYGPRGDNAFLEDTIEALNDKRYGPSWDAFIETLVNGNLFGIATTRGHEPDTLRKGVEYIIYNELNSEQQDKMLRSLMKYHDAFDEDFDYLVDDYLNNCIFIGVMSEGFTKLFGYKAHKKPTEGKREAVNYIVKKFKKYKDKLDVPMSFGFSDDDVNYYDTVKDLFVSYDEPLDDIEYFMFDTSDPKLKGGKKEKILSENTDVVNFDEDWEEEVKPKKEEKSYDGNIIRFLEGLNNKRINNLVDELFGSDDLDERMDIAERILSIIEEDYEEYYFDVEDDIKELTLD